MKPCVADVKPLCVEPFVQILQTDHLFYQMAAAQHMTTWIPDLWTLSNSTYIMEPSVADVKPLCVEPIVQMLRTDQLLHGGSTRFSSMVDGSSPSWWIHFHQMAAATHGHLESCCIILAVTALLNVISTSLIRQFDKIGRLSLLFSSNGRDTNRHWIAYLFWTFWNIKHSKFEPNMNQSMRWIEWGNYFLLQSEHFLHDQLQSSILSAQQHADRNWIIWLVVSNPSGTVHFEEHAICLWYSEGSPPP